MTKDFEIFVAAIFAAPSVLEFCESFDSFQTLARRFAAKVLQPGAGSMALQLSSDLVTALSVGFVNVLENKSEPRGFMHIFDFQTIVAEVFLCATAVAKKIHPFASA